MVDTSFSNGFGPAGRPQPAGMMLRNPLRHLSPRLQTPAHTFFHQSLYPSATYLLIYSDPIRASIPRTSPCCFNSPVCLDEISALDSRAPDLPSLGPNYLTCHPRKPTPFHHFHPPSPPTPPVLPKIVKWLVSYSARNTLGPLPGRAEVRPPKSPSPPRTPIETSQSGKPSDTAHAVLWKSQLEATLIAGLPFSIRDNLLCATHFLALSLVAKC